jgi:hypothetical protein
MHGATVGGVTYLGHSLYRGNYSFFCQNVAMHKHSSNQYTIPSAHHLHTGLITRHITATSNAPRRLNKFNFQDFNHYPFLTYINITYIILTVIIIIFNCYGVTSTQLTIPISRPTDATWDRFLFSIYMCITLHVWSVKCSSSGVPHRTYSHQFLCLCISAALSCKKLWGVFFN